MTPSFLSPLRLSLGLGTAAWLALALSASASASASAEETVFPLEIAHAFGTTTIEGVPQRIAVAGLIEHDTLLALGIKPVAIRGWFTDYPNATGPWAQHLWEGVEPVSVAGEGINFEALLGSDPDLILAIYTNLDQETYDRLAAIAPTVAWTEDGGAWGTPWRDNARTIGRIVDRQDEIEVLIQGVEDAFVAAQETYPELVGARGVAANSVPNGFVIRGDQYDTGALLTGLGVEYPEEILAQIDSHNVNHFSWENLDLIREGLDVVLWDVHGDSTVAAIVELLDTLEVYPGEDRIVFNWVLSDAAAAMATQSVLSFPYAIDQLAPRLAAALDGDPATPAN